MFNFSAYIYLKKICRYLFFIFLVLVVFSYFEKDRYASVDQIVPEINPAPIQTALSRVDQTPITFVKNNYNYTVTPLYDYTLNGLVLHTQKYDTWYSLNRIDKTFTKDVCMIWGKTLEEKGYQDSTLHVGQDYRWCFYSYATSGLVFNATEFSNNHLIASSPEIEKKILSIDGGDQVRITGKLVNVHATMINTNQREQYEAPQIDWNSSVTRDDTGAGACETIYVENIEIIKKGNPVFHILYSVSLYGLGTIIFWLITEFIFGFSKSIRQTRGYSDKIKS